MKKNLKITVCVPTYNRYKDLENIINSFSHQDYPDAELLILDDLGSPEIEEVAKKWMKKSNKIVYHKNAQNLGYTNNMRQAFTFASGDIITYMGDDDIFIDDHALGLIAQAFQNETVGVVKASQILFKNGKVNQVYPLKKDKEEIIFYKKGLDTYEHLWFESLSISGLAFRNIKKIRELVNKHITLYPQVEHMGLVCLWYDSAEINKHVIGVQSHSNQLNCISYDIEDVRTNIFEDWMHFFKRITLQAKNAKEPFLSQSRFVEKFSHFVLYFLPYNTISNGKIDTMMFIFTIIKYNKHILLTPFFWIATLSSLLLPKNLLKQLIEWVKAGRLQKQLSNDEILDFNKVLTFYYK